MTHSRSETSNTRNSRQTEPSGGCLSGFMIPPLIVLCFGVILAFSTTGLKWPSPKAGTLSGTGTLAPLFTPEIQFWSASLNRWGAEHGLDPNIAATVMQIESCGNPDALSGAGAAGLFQVMPFHFEANEDAFDPEINALRGLNYLAAAMEASGGDVRLALAGYNGGIGVINQAESNWADETIRYAYWGSGIYADAALNANRSTRLDEWLAAGGASLCGSASQRLGISQ